MLQVNHGNVVIHGHKLVLKAELATLIHGLAESGFSKEEIMTVVKVGLMTDEELDKGVKEVDQAIPINFDDLIKRMFEGRL